MDREYRTATEAWPDEDLALRATAAGTGVEGLRFAGYAAAFDRPSEPMPGGRAGTFREVVAPGAFDRTLAQRGQQVKMFWNHDQNDLLASVKAGTLGIEPDARGLNTWSDLPDTTVGRHKAELVRRGDADSMSFGFLPVKDEWTPDGKTRTLVEVRLFEVSIVAAWPAYRATSATVRTLAEEIDAEPDELAGAFRVLRDAEGRLADDQVRLLMAAINSRREHPAIVATTLADYRERFAARGYRV